jgi:cobalamin biosynthesis Mg chelatase CobN
LTAERLAELTPDKFPTELYSPTFTDGMMAIGLVGVGYMVTTLVALIGGAKPPRR